LASTSKIPPQFGQPHFERLSGGGDLVQAFGFHVISDAKETGL
jgi:hypothetical protein